MIAGHGMGATKDRDKHLGRKLPATGICSSSRPTATRWCPPAHGRALFERTREPRRLHLITEADHRLSETVHRLEAIEESRRWLLAHLAPTERTR